MYVYTYIYVSKPKAVVHECSKIPKVYQLHVVLCLRTLFTRYI